MQAIVLRIGELFLKGRNRHQFERQLERNVRCTLRSLGGWSVSVGHGRLFAQGPRESAAEAVRRLTGTFGIASLSRAVLCDFDIDAIDATAVALARAASEKGARSFAVVTRRPNKSFPHKSGEVNVRVGRAIEAATGMRVDLDHPELTVSIEIGHERTFVTGEKVPGAGGLPVGSSGTAMLLLSGGIDSPVAGWLAQKRGLRLQAIYFHSFPHVGDRAREKVVELSRILASFQCGMKLWVVPFATIQEALRDGAPPRQLVLLYRRMMVRIAEAHARREGCEALVTGDSLGQVASQTLANLACVERAATLPLLRPLVAYDKADTVKLARGIGTFDRSAEPAEDCCSLFVPQFPETRGRPEILDEIERAFPIAEWSETRGHALGVQGP